MKSLITAEEARALNQDMRIYMASVDMIRRAALNGQTQVFIRSLTEEVKTQLETDGFVICPHDDSDPQLENSWWISWKKEK